MFEVAIATGVRASELLNIEKRDLNDRDKSIFIRTLKGGVDRELPLQKPLYKKIRKFADTLKTEKIFNISYVRLNQIWIGYRPVEKKFHALRHTKAIQVYKKSRSARHVMMVLGHKKLETAEIYLQFVENKETLRKLL